MGIRSGLTIASLSASKLEVMYAEKIVRSTLKAWGPDLVWCETVIPAAAAIKAVEQAVPVVADVHGLASAEYEEATASNGPDTKTLSRIKDAEERLCSNSFRVIVVSSPMKDYLVAAYGVSRQTRCAQSQMVQMFEKRGPSTPTLTRSSTGEFSVLGRALTSFLISRRWIGNINSIYWAEAL